MCLHPLGEGSGEGALRRLGVRALISGLQQGEVKLKLAGHCDARPFVQIRVVARARSFDIRSRVLRAGGAAHTGRATRRPPTRRPSTAGL